MHQERLTLQNQIQFAIPVYGKGTVLSNRMYLLRVAAKRKAQNMEKGIRMYLETWDCLNQKYCNTYIEEVKNNYHMMSI